MPTSCNELRANDACQGFRIYNAGVGSVGNRASIVASFCAEKFVWGTSGRKGWT
jgi:hypothetical protein